MDIILNYILYFILYIYSIIYYIDDINCHWTVDFKFPACFALNIFLRRASRCYF